MLEREHQTTMPQRCTVKRSNRVAGRGSVQPKAHLLGTGLTAGVLSVDLEQADGRCWNAERS